MKGVLICGGTGSRLRPLTEITNKSLLPVYDKPLILKPLSVLVDGGITEIAVITGLERMDQMAGFLGDGKKFGCTFTFIPQSEPKGIAHALGLAKTFADGDSVCVILGDNVFFDDLSPVIRSFATGGHVFLKEVRDPERFGVAEVKGDRVTSIEEKPLAPKSNLAQTGLYLFDGTCFDRISSLEPSARGEYEITDVTKLYMQNNALTFTILKDDWIDAGTFESLFQAGAMVRERQLKLKA